MSLNTGYKGDTGRKLGYIGVIAPSTEIKIVNNDGESLACNEEGELCVRGPQVMQGYWQQPEKTRALLLTQELAIARNATVRDKSKRAARKAAQAEAARSSKGRRRPNRASAARAPQGGRNGRGRGRNGGGRNQRGGRGRTARGRRGR